MANTSLGKDMDIPPFYRLKSYPRTMDGVLHSVSENDKG